MPGIYILAPLLLLGLGAGATAVLGSRATRLGRLLPAVVASLALVAGLPLLTRAPQRLIVSAWTVDPLPPLALSLQSDALSVPFLLIILLITAASYSHFLVFDFRFGNRQLAIENRKSEVAGAAGLLLLAAAGAAFVLAGDPLTLYVAWALMDLAIFAVVYAQTTREAVRALGVNVVLGLPLLFVAVTSEPGAGWARGSGQMWPALNIVALLVAAGARLGVYPAPFRSPGSHFRGALRRPLLELVPITGGAYLLLRVLSLLGLSAETGVGGVVPLGSLWVGVAGLAVAAGGFLAWCDDARAAVSWIVVVQAGLLLLTAGLRDLARAVALLQAFTLCLAPALMYLWLALDAWPAKRWGVLWIRGLGWLAVANLLGIPPTLGFVARWALYRHLLEGGAWHLVILLSTATGLTVPPLLRLMSAREQRSGGARVLGSRGAEVQRSRGEFSLAPPWPGRQGGQHLCTSAQVVGVSLVGLVLLLIGLQPLLLLSPLQMLMGTAGAFLAQVIRGTSQIVGIEVVLALFLPILAGYVLATSVSSYATVTSTVEGVTTRLHARLGSGDDALMRLRQRLRVGLSLAWTYEVVERGAWRLGTMIRTLIAPLEGERYWGWTFLFALLVALLVLSG